MNVEELKQLAKGQKATVLDGKGYILVDFEADLFLAILTDQDFLIDCCTTWEEALEAIKVWEDEE